MHRGYVSHAVLAVTALIAVTAVIAVITVIAIITAIAVAVIAVIAVMLVRSASFGVHMWLARPPKPQEAPQSVPEAPVATPGESGSPIMSMDVFSGDGAAEHAPEARRPPLASIEGPKPAMAELMEGARRTAQAKLDTLESVVGKSSASSKSLWGWVDKKAGGKLGETWNAAKTAAEEGLTSVAKGLESKVAETVAETKGIVERLPFSTDSAVVDESMKVGFRLLGVDRVRISAYQVDLREFGAFCAWCDQLSVTMSSGLGRQLLSLPFGSKVGEKLVRCPAALEEAQDVLFSVQPHLQAVNLCLGQVVLIVEPSRQPIENEAWVGEVLWLQSSRLVFHSQQRMSDFIDVRVYSAETSFPLENAEIILRAMNPLHVDPSEALHANTTCCGDAVLAHQYGLSTLTQKLFVSAKYGQDSMFEILNPTGARSRSSIERSLFKFHVWCLTAAAYPGETVTLLGAMRQLIADGGAVLGSGIAFELRDAASGKAIDGNGTSGVTMPAESGLFRVRLQIPPNLPSSRCLIHFAYPPPPPDVDMGQSGHDAAEWVGATFPLIVAPAFCTFSVELRPSANVVHAEEIVVIHALVQDSAGLPVEGCAVQWYAHQSQPVRRLEVGKLWRGFTDGCGRHAVRIDLSGTSPMRNSCLRIRCEVTAVDGTVVQQSLALPITYRQQLRIESTGPLLLAMAGDFEARLSLNIADPT
jgi:hypothetical protein